MSFYFQGFNKNNNYSNIINIINIKNNILQNMPNYKISKIRIFQYRQMVHRNFFFVRFGTENFDMVASHVGEH